MIQALSQHSLTTTELSIAQEVLGDDIEVWAYDNQWRFVTRGVSQESRVSQEVGSELILHLSQIPEGAAARFEPLNNGRTLCLLSVGSGWKPKVAVRVLSANSIELLEIATRASALAIETGQRYRGMQRRLYEAESQLATFSNRISRGDAELLWLRELATHSELSETRNDPIQAAQKILPEMCRIISARTVVFVSEPAGLDVDGIAMNAWQAGESRVPDQVCRALIKELGPDAQQKPAIVNYPVPQHRAPDFAGVLSAIVKSVSRNGRQTGWLIAVNKDLQHLAQRTDQEPLPGAIDRICEFGAFESSVVTAAANAMAAHTHNCNLLEEKHSLVSGTIRSLVNAIDAKDHYTCGHSDRVAEYARQIASTMKLGVEFCERIYMTGLLHDVGKIGVPDSVLQKPGRLTDEEFDRIKEHPAIGYEILRHLSAFDYVLPGVLHHHEAVDGSGYPHGLVGDQIPLDARILAVADAYDAMTSDRPYRDGMSSQKAEAIIADGAGRQWDAECVLAFRKCIDGIRLVAHDEHRSGMQGPNLSFGSIDKPLTDEYNRSHGRKIQRTANVGMESGQSSGNGF